MCVKYFYIMYYIVEHFKSNCAFGNLYFHIINTSDLLLTKECGTVNLEILNLPKFSFSQTTTHMVWSILIGFYF